MAENLCVYMDRGRKSSGLNKSLRRGRPVVFRPLMTTRKVYYPRKGIVCHIGEVVPAGFGAAEVQSWALFRMATKNSGSKQTVIVSFLFPVYTVIIIQWYTKHSDGTPKTMMF